MKTFNLTITNKDGSERSLDQQYASANKDLSFRYWNRPSELHQWNRVYPAGFNLVNWQNDWMAATANTLTGSTQPLNFQGLAGGLNVVYSDPERRTVTFRGEPMQMRGVSSSFIMDELGLEAPQVTPRQHLEQHRIYVREHERREMQRQAERERLEAERNNRTPWQRLTSRFRD